MALTVLFELEYDVSTEEEARAHAYRDAGRLFRESHVLAISADLKRSRAEELPITQQYLQDEPIKDVAARVEEYTPHQMDVDECIAEVLNEASE